MATRMSEPSSARRLSREEMPAGLTPRGTREGEQNTEQGGKSGCEMGDGVMWVASLVECEMYVLCDVSRPRGLDAECSTVQMTHHRCCLPTHTLPAW